MKYLITLIISLVLTIKGKPHEAAFVWFCLIALFHAIEEAQGKLWVYFAERASVDWLKQQPSFWGFILIVAPALVLQISVAYFAILQNAEINLFWLGVLIGLRVGDFLFSHATLFARDLKSNPGLSSAFIYGVDGILTFIIHPNSSLFGIMIGAIFFASVIPLLKLTRWIEPNKLNY